MNHTMHNSNIIRRTFIVLIALPLFITACGDDKEQAPQPFTLEWKAGQALTQEQIDQYGIDRCFTSEEISEALFARIYGKSYKTDCTVPRSDLRYLKVLHKNLQGQPIMGEVICNKSITADLLDIFRQLYDACYPIERMVLIDDYDADDERSMLANNSSAFNFRFVAGTTTLSNHSQGLAIDINPLYNPYVKARADGSLYVSPEAGRPYADRSATFNYKIDHSDLCYKLFIAHGFEWGGNWTSLKDYQHFEKP